ncbi:MAG: hypothetical protein Q9179_007076 [Wetmoreana sp. 5 TL-2023]
MYNQIRWDGHPSAHDEGERQPQEAEHFTKRLRPQRNAPSLEPLVWAQSQRPALVANNDMDIAVDIESIEQLETALKEAKEKIKLLKTTLVETLKEFETVMEVVENLARRLADSKARIGIHKRISTQSGRTKGQDSGHALSLQNYPGYSYPNTLDFGGIEASKKNFIGFTKAMTYNDTDMNDFDLYEVGSNNDVVKKDKRENSLAATENQRGRKKPTILSGTI